MKKKLSIILCILWMGFIFYNSSQTGYKSNERSVKVLNVIKQFKNDTLNIIKELISDNKSSSLNKHIIYNEDKAFNKSDKSLNINLAINKNKSNYTKLSIEEVNNIEKINTISLASNLTRDTKNMNKIEKINNIKYSKISIIKIKAKDFFIKARDKIKIFVYKYFKNFNVFVRKSAHAFEFLVLAMLILWAMTCHDVKGIKAIFFTLLIVLFYAITDEFHQLFVYGRGASLKDVKIDFIGGVIGSIFYSLISLRTNLKSKKIREV